MTSPIHQLMALSFCRPFRRLSLKLGGGWCVGRISEGAEGCRVELVDDACVIDRLIGLSATHLRPRWA